MAERRTKRQAQAEATRAQLVRAAYEVFSEVGYRDATIQAITKAADTAHGTFYLYFRNKDHALETVIDDVMQDLSTRALTFERGGDIRKELANVARDSVEILQSRRGFFRALLEGALASPEVAERWNVVRARYFDWVAEVFESLWGTEAAGSVDWHSRALVIVAIGEWALMQYVLAPDPSEVPMENIYNTMMEIFVGALTPADDAAPD